MRAVVYDRYGPPAVLHIEEVEAPVPGDDQVLVRVHATSVTRSDTRCAAERTAFQGWCFASSGYLGEPTPKADLGRLCHLILTA